MHLPPSVMLHWLHRLVLTSYFALLLLTVIWHTWLFPSVYFPTSLVLMVTALPLLLPLRSLLHGRPRSHIWAALLSMLYFTHGVGEAFASPQQRWLGLLEILLSLTLVFSASLYVRTESRTPAADTGNGTSPPPVSDREDRSSEGTP